MSRLAYLPLYVRDFLADPKVLALPWIEQGIYLRMLMLAWELGPLPTNEDTLVRMIGLVGEGRVDEPEACVRTVLELCWTKTKAGWVSPRLERERQHGLAIAAARSKASAEANRRRWRIPNGSVTDPNRIPSQAQAQAQAQEKNPLFGEERGEEPEKGGKPPAPVGAPPPPGGGSKRKDKPRWQGSIPPALAGERFQAAWGRWLRFRDEELRKPVTQLSGDQTLQELARMGLQRACAAIDYTIARGWQGLREPEPPRGPRGGSDVTPGPGKDGVFKELGL